VVREPRGYRSVVCHFRSTAVDKGARGGAPFGEVLFGCRHNLRRGAQGSRGQSCNSQPEGCGYVRYSQLSGLCRGCGRTEPPAISPERPCLPLRVDGQFDILLEFAKLLLCPCSCHVRRLDAVCRLARCGLRLLSSADRSRSELAAAAPAPHHAPRPPDDARSWPAGRGGRGRAPQRCPSFLMKFSPTRQPPNLEQAAKTYRKRTTNN
jgi:hypothetical protein